MNPLYIRGVDEGDVMYNSDTGHWNITRALRDCLAGKHQLYALDVAEAASYCMKVTVDADKVAAMIANPQALYDAPPAIAVIDGGKLYVIDGHHRLRAGLQLGQKVFGAWVIEEKDADQYRITFNGEKLCPPDLLKVLTS